MLYEVITRCCEGSWIPLTQANPCYGDADLGDMAFEWRMLDESGTSACVPTVDPPCSMDPTDPIRPQVVCDEPGAYAIELVVTDTYGAHTDVLDDCAYLYVPEPGRGTLLRNNFV